MNEPYSPASATAPIVSVVIPCYRQAHFLPEAVESVLAQTYPHHEIVVVDDGSPDDTREVARRYPQVRYLHQANQGLSVARNAGIRASTGEFVVCLDADDRLTPEALAVGVRELLAHPECACVAGDHLLVDENRNIVPSWPRTPIARDHYLALLRGNAFWCPATVVYRRSVFDAIGGFDPSVNPAADYDMYLRIARRFPIHTHAHPVADYRVHRSGMSRNSALMLEHSMRVLRAQRRLIKGQPAYEEACDAGIQACQTLYGTRLVADIGEHLRGGQWLRGMRESLVALRYHYPYIVAQAYQRVYRSIVEAFS